MHRDQWVLKQPALSAVFNLRQGQLRLLRVAEGVYRTQPDLIVTGFHRDYHPLAYWTFVILYNIRRPQQEPGRSPRCRGPASTRPCEKCPTSAAGCRPRRTPPGRTRSATSATKKKKKRKEKEEGRKQEFLPRVYLCPDRT